jgi:hypothetical protein
VLFAVQVVDTVMSLLTKISAAFAPPHTARVVATQAATRIDTLFMLFTAIWVSFLSRSLGTVTQERSLETDCHRAE